MASTKKSTKKTTKATRKSTKKQVRKSTTKKQPVAITGDVRHNAAVKAWETRRANAQKAA